MARPRRFLRHKGRQPGIHRAVAWMHRATALIRGVAAWDTQGCRLDTWGCRLDTWGCRLDAWGCILRARGCSRGLARCGGAPDLRHVRRLRIEGGIHRSAHEGDPLARPGGASSGGGRSGCDGLRVQLVGRLGNESRSLGGSRWLGQRHLAGKRATTYARAQVCTWWATHTLVPKLMRLVHACAHAHAHLALPKGRVHRTCMQVWHVITRDPWA